MAKSRLIHTKLIFLLLSINNSKKEKTDILKRMFEEFYLRVLSKLVLQSILSSSGRSEVFCKKGVLRTFAEFTGKHLCQRL